MKSQCIGPVAFLVPLIFCSSLSAQTAQPFSVQVSGLSHAMDYGDRWDWGGEGQVRWTRGAWSFGAGVQYTFGREKADDEFTSFDYHVSTLGIFLEPRFVFMVLADRFGLYVHARPAVSRISENESGTLRINDEFGTTIGLDPYSLEGTSMALSGYGGPGILVRLTSSMNLDLGGAVGYAWWKQRVQASDTRDSRTRPKWFFSKGAWIGLVIGMG